MAASLSWTLKVEFEGDVRRLRNWPEQGCEPSFESLRSAVGVLLGFGRLDAEPLSIKYRDDEGDLCTLNEATLPDALALAAEPPRLLRLMLARVSSGDGSAGAATPTRGVAELEAAPLPAVPPSTPATACAAEAPADAAAVAAASGSATEGAAAAAAVASGAAGEAEAVAEVQRQLGQVLAHFGCKATPLPAVPLSTPAPTCPAEAPADAAAEDAASGSATEGAAAAAAVASGAAGDAEAVAEVQRQLGQVLAHFGRKATPLPAVPLSTPASACAAEAPADAAAVAVVSGSASEGETAAAAVASSAAGEAEAVAEAVTAEGRTRVRRQLREGLAHFGRQVASDFCSARTDAKDAFRPKGNLAGREERACLVDKVSAVPATVMGAVVAARLAPVRLTKLAAHSVATVAGKSTSMEDWEPLGMDNALSTEEPSAVEARDSTAGGSGDLKEEFRHFTQQVTQDFQVAKADVQAAFSCVLGGPRPSAEHHPSAQEEPSPPQPAQDQLEQSAPRQEEQEPQLERPPQSEAQQRWTARSAVPALASTVAGVTVASTLVPVRALRLAVASAAAVASARAAGRQETTGAAGAVRTEEGPAEPLRADQEEDEAVTGTAAQLAEDEVLARRLQAEEDADAAMASAHAAVPTTPAATSQP